MDFRKAKIEDLQEVFALFQSGIQSMRDNGIDQWDEIYPDKKILQEDIEKGEMFLGFCEGKPASAFVLNGEYDEQYRNGDWLNKDGNFLVLHRLCVNYKFQGKGISKITLQYIEDLAKSMGAASIRLDVFPKNPKACALYQKNGFQKTGIVHFRKGEFFLMEKLL